MVRNTSLYENVLVSKKIIVAPMRNLGPNNTHENLQKLGSWKTSS